MPVVSPPHVVAILDIHTCPQYRIVGQQSTIQSVLLLCWSNKSQKTDFWQENHQVCFFPKSQIFCGGGFFFCAAPIAMDLGPQGPKRPHGVPWGPLGPHGAPRGPMGPLGAPWAPWGPRAPKGLRLSTIVSLDSVRAVGGNGPHGAPWAMGRHIPVAHHGD